jgi:uncharacterized membrane protein YfcA
MAIPVVATFFGAGLVAELIATIAGFGSSTLLMPVAVLLFDFPTALVLVGVFHIAGSASRTVFFRHGLDRRILLLFGLPSLAFTMAGAALVRSTPEQTLKGVLGLFLITYAVISLYRGLRLRPSAPAMAVGGAVSGFLAGLIGTGGALRGAFLSAFQLPRDAYLANAALIALAVDLTRLPIYFGQGFSRSIPWTYYPLLIGIAWTGAFVGRRLVTRIPQDRFRTVVFGLLLLVGIAFSLRWILDLVGKD